MNLKSSRAKALAHIWKINKRPKARWKWLIFQLELVIDAREYVEYIVCLFLMGNRIRLHTI
jgi:hypothetical protein